jgi:hypothetical protein
MVLMDQSQIASSEKGFERSSTEGKKQLNGFLLGFRSEENSGDSVEEGMLEVEEEVC